MPQMQQLPDLQNVEFMPIGLGNRILQQADSTQQFNQQGLQQGQADLEAKTLANMFSSQNNPQLLDQQRLMNEGKGLANQIQGVEARNTLATEGESLAARRSKMLASASEDDLKRLLADAQTDMQSDDPAVVARGDRKMKASWEEVTRRNKHKDTIELENVKGDRARDVANIHAGATRYAADKSAEARAAGAKGKITPQDFSTAVLMGKITPQKAAVYWSEQARTADTEEERLAATTEAARYERLAQTTTPAVASQGGKLDTGSYTGLPTRPIPSAFGGQPQQPKSLNQLPQGAKQIGTSGGKPVYQTPDGKKFIGE